MHDMDMKCEGETNSLNQMDS